MTKQYYGTDEATWASLDPYTKIDSYQGKRVPTFIINMNHLSTSMSLGSGDDSLGAEMRDFIRQALPQAPHTARATSTMR